MHRPIPGILLNYRAEAHLNGKLAQISEALLEGATDLQIAKEDKMADAVIITTLDDLHKEPAIAFSGKGYHLLVEKPLAPSLEDCLEVTEACKKNNTILVVGHVLRYMPHFQKVKNLIEDGVIGDVVHVEHMEPIGWYHFAHSYVRGNWRNEKESGFSLLTKSCHDVDLIQTFMQGSKCQRISSFGSLSHFNRQNKPENAGDSCFNCEIEDSCQYSALKLYLSPMRLGFPNHFCNVVCPTGSVEEFEDVLRKGPYSRCVYNCDNDVMSNQVVNMEYEGGKTVSFSMIAFTEKLCQRQIKIFGTKGEMSCSSDQEISVYDFKRQQRSVCPVSRIPTDLTRLRGHGYADYFLMHAFVKSVCNEDQSYSLTGPDDTLESHRLVFMAEKSRVEGRVIDLTVE